MSGALHYSEGKPGVDQLPPGPLIEVARVFSYGALKYTRDNWKKGNEWHEFYGSALRHLFAWWGGIDTDKCDPDCTVDPDLGVCRKHSNLHHLAHAAWNCLALLYFQQNGLGADNRDGTLGKRDVTAAEFLGIPLRTIPYSQTSGAYAEAEVEEAEAKIAHHGEKNCLYRTFNDGGKFHGRPIPGSVSVITKVSC